MANAKLPESFAEYPLSVTERRALKKDGDAAKWLPRDALISILRRIDSGEIKPEALIVIIREEDEEGTITRYSNASPNLHTALGLLEHVKYRLLTDWK